MSLYLDTAVEPVEPIKPKKLQIILAIFFGGFIGTLIAFVTKYVTYRYQR